MVQLSYQYMTTGKIIILTRWAFVGKVTSRFSKCNLGFTSTSITSHIHSWVLFLLWIHPFILSGVISPLISSSVLGTYRPGEFLFQYPIILPFHTVHGVLKERILKWFAIPFSSGLHSVRRYNQSILKEISPGCSLERLMLKLKLQYFGHLMRRVDSLEKTLMLGGIEGRRRRV